MDLEAMLSAERSSDRVATVVRYALSRSDPARDCPMYLAALDRALWEEPPPCGTGFYADIYRTASANGQWTAISLIKDAEWTGNWARHVWSLAAGCTHDETQDLLARLAVEASSRVFACLALLDLTFPGAITPPFRSQLEGLSPGYSMAQAPRTEDELSHASVLSLEALLRVNLAEIRRVIRQSLQRSALLAHGSTDNLPEISRIEDSLIRVGLDHVAGTATWIEHHACGAQPEELSMLFCGCLCRFNRDTSEESIDFTYNQRFGNYP
jgi:hypothetical protein